jgi:dipeptidyl aminopeptidase/acylaminoacyl peptidase
MTLAAGTRLGPYEILSPLGAGGMGEVYLGRDTRLERQVAIKVLPADVAKDAERLRRFEKEARSASALNHPNIVTIHDIGSEGGVSYIAMERVEGTTLSALLLGGSLPSKKLLPIATQVAEGLSKAHEAGIIHRDLKPENVMVTKDGLVKILDFGLAKLSSSAGSGSDEGSQLPTLTVTTPGVVVGTVAYMSPEQAGGEHVDFRSDQFSFGSMLYEMVTGKKAFQKKTAVDTLAAILNEDPEPIAVINPQSPAPLHWIVERCLAKEPEGRYVSSKDLARDLAMLRDHLSQTSNVITAVSARRSGRVAGLLAVATALSIGFAAYVWVSSNARNAREVTFRRMTFGRGVVAQAQFAPDGRTVVYDALWEGRPRELFTVRTDGTESKPLGIRDQSLKCISTKGELAIVLSSGTLARVPLGGGAPREVLEHVGDACWGPDGEDLVVVRTASSGEDWLEYPIGHVLVPSTTHGLGMPQVSRDGRLVAFAENVDFQSDNIVVVDRSGKRRDLSTGWRDVSSMSWSGGGDEIFFTAGKTQESFSLRAVNLSGRERVLIPGASDITVQDVSADGRLLVIRSSFGPNSLLFGGVDGSHETQLAWLDRDWLAALSEDGTKVLIGTGGEGASPNGDVFLRPTDGTPPVRLGDGIPLGLSPDGKWALAKTNRNPPELLLLPTGPGTPRKVPLPKVTRWRADFLPDGRIVIEDVSPTGTHLSVVGLDGGNELVLNVKDVGPGNMVSSPDGSALAMVTTDHKIEVISTSGGPPRVLQGAVVEPDEGLIQWSADGRFLYMQAFTGKPPAKASQLDIRTGEKTPWKELKPAVTSVAWIDKIFLTRDGRSWAYAYGVPGNSTLYLVSGLK